MKIPVYKTEGIILRRFEANEWDRLLVVYTKEFGKVLVKAKSLRKKEAKMKAQLELFNHVHLILAKGKNMDTISGVVLLNGFPNMRKNLESLAAAFYIGELLDKLIIGPEKDERIWQLVLKALNFLEKLANFSKSSKNNTLVIKKLINRFEYNLLAFLGHKPEKEIKSYLDMIQSLLGEKIESQAFLARVLT